MNPTTMQILATVLFALALVHTFSVKRFEHLATKHPSGSVGENFFHILGEIEVVFGIWAGVYLFAMLWIEGADPVIEYMDGLNFTEPAFVFVIMTISATRPVIHAASAIISFIARLIPLHPDLAFFAVALIVGPLLGSLITEPAAMTVTALILKQRYYDRGISGSLMYATLAVLFVNISIGGTLTDFAAPPVLMVASTWDWDSLHMISHFGWKSATALTLNTIALTMIYRRELKNLKRPKTGSVKGMTSAPTWLVLIHLAFLFVIVLSSHHMEIFIGLFLFFLGVATVTKEHQDELQLREALLVGFFLGGLVTLGGPQRWWLQPLLTKLDEVALFLGTTGLTGITDNAALTYLGSQVPGISDSLKYSLMAGAVVGGGLTVIANAPNPAGFGILKESFGREGISPVVLLVAALPPTLVAMACLWFLPSL